MAEPKKMAVLHILEILQKYSDENHPLTQAKIIYYLKHDHDIEMERKAIGKSLSELQMIEKYKVASKRGGYYIEERDFTDSTLRLLIDAVLQSKYITAAHSNEIIGNLCKLSNIHFRSHVNNVYSVKDWNKTENASIFLNIELIDEAISTKRQITYDYNKYGIDGKLHRSSTQTITPYQLIMHNQRYYLMGHSEKWKNLAFHRLDRITGMEIVKDSKATPITSIKGYENGIDYNKIASTLPYMYTDEPERITFIVDDFIVDQVVDWFGKNIKMEKVREDESKVRVQLFSSPNAMEHWALQYAAHVEIVSPAHLRDRVKKVLAESLERYSK